MNIKKLLQKQGEIYHNLTSNKTVQTYNKILESEVKYKNYWISEQEHEVIKELEKLLGKEPAIREFQSMASSSVFEIFVEVNKIIYLRIVNMDLTEIPKQINNLTNLRRLVLHANKITEIKNLDKLINLQFLNLFDNKIHEIKGLKKLTNLQKLYLNYNSIHEINGLNNLPNLQILWLYKNKIQKIENLDNLLNLQELYLEWNQIQKIKGINKLTNLKILNLRCNPIKNKEEVKNLRKRKVDVII